MKPPLAQSSAAQQIPPSPSPAPLADDYSQSQPQRHLHDHSPGHPQDHAPGQATQHVHSEASRKRIINRLSRIEGHIRGIKTMVQDDRACPDVLVQIAAIRGGLDRVARIILDEHLSECITRAVDEGNIEAELDALKAALDRFI
ncbi:MAG: metal-sensing transcriptional repressor [Phormidesmis sp.]